MKVTHKILISFGVIILLVVSGFGISTYMSFENEKRLDQENYPYPQIYDAIRKDCPALIDGKYKLDTDNGYYINYGFFALYSDEKKYEVRIVVNQDDVIDLLEVYFSEPNLTIDKSRPNLKYIGFDRDKHIVVHNQDYQDASTAQKQAFEQEMIKRLERC